MAKEKQSLDDFVKSLQETGKKKDAAIQQFIEDNASFQAGDQIVLTVPPGQSVRVQVIKVSAELNNLTGKMELAYQFNDDSLLFESALKEKGYDWCFEKSLEAQEVKDEPDTV